MSRIKKLKQEELTQILSESQKNSVEFAQEFFADLLEKTGTILPAFTFDNEKGERVLLGSDGFRKDNPIESKNLFALAARAMARRVNATMSIFVSEAWMLPAERIKEAQRKEGGYKSFGDVEGREEVIMLVIELVGGKYIHGRSKITRGEDGKPKPGPFEFVYEEQDHGGRFHRILPTADNELTFQEKLSIANHMIEERNGRYYNLVGEDVTEAFKKMLGQDESD